MSADLMFRMTTTGDREGGASETRANGRAKLSLRASRAFGVLSARAFGRAAVMAAALVLAGCQADEVATVSPYKTVYGGPQKSRAPVSPILVARMQTLDMDKNSPIMVRLFKKESKLEVWKQTRNGRYALLETFDICKWSGNLGPKVKEGDRQAPEGFYMITQGLMNPNSSYYLAFNTGFPNAYDRSLGRYGTNLMVHGACSSRGCYAMTDPQIEQIYALARDAFAGGQKAFQFQAYPFKMTPENIAEHYDDPNMPFWKMLKEGYDHFEVTRQVPKVDVCGRKYVFDSTPVKSGAALVPTRDCPELTMPQTLQLAVASKSKQDDVKVAALLPKVKREKQREEDAARFLMIASANPNPNQSTIVRPGLPQPIAKRPAAASVMIASAAPSAAPASTAPSAATAAPLPAEAAVASATTAATGSARPAVAEAAIAAAPAATPGQVQVASADTESSGLLPPEKPGAAQADQAGEARTANAGILESGGTMIRGWFDGLFGKPKTPAGEGAPATVLAGAAEADPAASAAAQATPAQGAPVQVLPVHPAGVATASAQPAAPVQVASLEASGASAASLPANLSMEVLPVPRPALSGGAASAAPAVVPAVPAAAAAPAVASPALAAPVAAPAKPVAVIPTPATAAATDAMAAAPLRASVPATTPAAGHASPAAAAPVVASQPAVAAKPVVAKPVAAKPVAAKPAAPVASAEPAASAAPAANAAPAASKPLVLDSANPPAKKSVFAKAFDMFGE